MNIASFFTFHFWFFAFFFQTFKSGNNLFWNKIRNILNLGTQKSKKKTYYPLWIIFPISYLSSSLFSCRNSSRYLFIWNHDINRWMNRRDMCFYIWNYSEAKQIFFYRKCFWYHLSAHLRNLLVLSSNYIQFQASSIKAFLFHLLLLLYAIRLLCEVHNPNPHNAI